MKTRLTFNLKYLSTAILAAGLSLTPCTMKADQVMVSNLANISGSYVGYGSILGRAQGFTTNASGGKLSKIEVALAMPAAPLSATMRLYTDTGGLPSGKNGTGTVLETFNIGPFTATPGYYYYFSFNSVIHPMLSPNTRYWLAIEASSTQASTIGWMFSNPSGSSYDSINHWTTNNYARYSTGGWGLSAVGGLPDARLSYSISIIPEPSTYAAGIGLASLGLVAWRKTKTRATLAIQ